ncbi:uracil-DNA glycosylase [Christiangramia forsetii]|uniref:Uracil-DNA glycosylase n=2 Tax=Christiangramia forsetii TaxID=411153 RepID=UNG_CHRFK|nr:uracil-DNA glycosylase [Christiangramia forsetii]A0M1V1.1 RecName: Full=Uracil-DNA glycosylase; Short=UDG [Christiangramia forsetii KT0803]GGG45290.1 uracil-DNA glycosylase 2 [Christiangramia forsetii]CAL66596.1 uracil-DNA glycosylase [Christiangramia forsetii KT0803]
MNVRIDQSWKNKLDNEFEKEYFENLITYIKDEYSEHKCFPPGNEIFAAFDYSSFEDTKVVILGQDPYHGIGQANGLCFSVKDGVAFPPSLINIFKEIESDLNKPIPSTGNLERWANQGVLLLNATLSVRAHQAGSHQNKGWETFTDQVIRIVSETKENVVFLLWGGYAKKKTKLIDNSKHLILTSGHPSPLSANRGYWFGNKHFSKTNEYLKSQGEQPIEW